MLANLAFSSSPEALVNDKYLRW